MLRTVGVAVGADVGAALGFREYLGRFPQLSSSTSVGCIDSNGVRPKVGAKVAVNEGTKLKDLEG